MGAITCTPIFKACVQGEGFSRLVLRRPRQSGQSLAACLTCWQIYMCFSYVSIIAYFLSAVVARAPKFSMLLNTLRIGHDAI